MQLANVFFVPCDIFSEDNVDTKPTHLRGANVVLHGLVFAVVAVVKYNLLILRNVLIHIIS